MLDLYLFVIKCHCLLGPKSLSLRIACFHILYSIQPSGCFDLTGWFVPCQCHSRFQAALQRVTVFPSASQWQPLSLRGLTAPAPATQAALGSMMQTLSKFIEAAVRSSLVTWNVVAMTMLKRKSLRILSDLCLTMFHGIAL